MSRDEAYVGWIKALNARGYLQAYAEPREWQALLERLHASVVDDFPQLHGRIPKDKIQMATERYCNAFPFIDTTQTLPSRGFLDAMCHADAAQIALKSHAHPLHAHTCPACAHKAAQISVLQQQLREAHGASLACVPDQDAFLHLMHQVYHAEFLHGVGQTPRTHVRKQVAAAVVRTLGIDISRQDALWREFVVTHLNDAEIQSGERYFRCCPRYTMLTSRSSQTQCADEPSAERSSMGCKRQRPRSPGVSGTSLHLTKHSS